MATFIVTYDLNRGDQSDYQDLYDELESFDSVRTQESVWLVSCSKTKSALFDALKAHVHTKDRLMVIEFASRPRWQNGLTGTKAWIDNLFPTT